VKFINNSSRKIDNNTGLKRLSTNAACEKNNYGNSSTFYISFVAQIIVGMGSAVYWTCGAAYLDDNVRKNIVPVLLGLSSKLNRNHRTYEDA